MNIILQRGDITKVECDAIVNAANEEMLGGGGVDGAIHRAAGPKLLEACLGVPEVTSNVRCPTGEARITDAFDLPAKSIIHTVGPIHFLAHPAATVRGETHSDPAEALASCFRNVLHLAEANGLRRIAFPAISCGIFGYPPLEAAEVARESLALRDWDVDEVVFVLFDEAVYDAFRMVFEPGFHDDDLSGMVMP